MEQVNKLTDLMTGLNIADKQIYPYLLTMDPETFGLLTSKLSAKDFINLALTCKAMYTYCMRYGRLRLPSRALYVSARETAISLEELSRTTYTVKKLKTLLPLKFVFFTNYWIIIELDTKQPFDVYEFFGKILAYIMPSRRRIDHLCVSLSVIYTFDEPFLSQLADFLKTIKPFHVSLVVPRSKAELLLNMPQIQKIQSLSLHAWPFPAQLRHHKFAWYMADTAEQLHRTINAFVHNSGPMIHVIPRCATEEQINMLTNRWNCTFLECNWDTNEALGYPSTAHTRSIIPSAYGTVEVFLCHGYQMTIRRVGISQAQVDSHLECIFDPANTYMVDSIIQHVRHYQE